MEKYIHVESQKTFYKTQVDCCYTIVCYDENNLGIVPKFDKGNEVIGRLTCFCDEGVIEVSKSDYDAACRKVLEMQIAFANKQQHN